VLSAINLGMEKWWCVSIRNGRGAVEDPVCAAKLSAGIAALALNAAIPKSSSRRDNAHGFPSPIFPSLSFFPSGIARLFVISLNLTVAILTGCEERGNSQIILATGSTYNRCVS